MLSSWCIHWRRRHRDLGNLNGGFTDWLKSTLPSLQQVFLVWLATGTPSPSRKQSWEIQSWFWKLSLHTGWELLWLGVWAQAPTTVAAAGVGSDVVGGQLLPVCGKLKGLCCTHYVFFLFCPFQETLLLLDILSRPVALLWWPFWCPMCSLLMRIFF